MLHKNEITKNIGKKIAKLFSQYTPLSAFAYLYNQLILIMPLDRVLMLYRINGTQKYQWGFSYGDTNDIGPATIQFDELIPEKAITRPASINTFPFIVHNNIDMRSFQSDSKWKKFSQHRDFCSIEYKANNQVNFLFTFWSNTPFVFNLDSCELLNHILTPFAELLSKDTKSITPTQDKQNLTSSDLLYLCPGLTSTMHKIEHVAPLDTNILILGETGVGKEVVADTLHLLSKRNKGPFVKVNCGAIPETLIDSELFGHEKGAYTGAHAAHLGFFEQASGGTIFLDEIGELTLASQVRLLRTLDKKEIQRIGSLRTIQVDIRILAATNRNLEEMVREGTFREDLYFRLNSFSILIVPLRRRPTDIKPLVNYFVEQQKKLLKLNYTPTIPKEAWTSLLEYSWPGNIRELRFVVEHAMINAAISNTKELLFETTFRNYKLRKEYIEKESTQAQQTEMNEYEITTINDNILPETWLSLEDYSNNYIIKAYEACHHKIYGKQGAAELLHMHPNTLRSRLEKLNIVIKTSLNQF